MHIIKLININKKFENNIIFNNFSCDIEEGKIIAITGKSGSGKSTLLNLIGGLEKPDSGVIEINGERNSWNKKKKINLFRNEIGYLFQNYALIDNMTVSQNLDIALKYIKCDNKENLKKQALKKVGMNNKYDRKVFELSGGEQQRVAIARLFLKPCKIILADEPTGSLDKENGKNVLRLLRELNNEGKTIVIVTHDEEIAKSCDEIMRI